jgi:hypothetical protein
MKPGETRNPGGKPVGARNRIQGAFLNQLADDFDAHGKQAIVEMRERDPSSYIRAIVALMPKELEIKRPLEEMSDDELAAGVAALQSFLAAQGAGEGAATAAGPEQAQGLPPIH